MPHPTDLHVGAEIARRRIAAGANQSDLGRALGVTFQQVQKYEKGTNRVSASKLQMAADFLGCRVGDLFPNPNAAPPEPAAVGFWSVSGAVPLSEAYRRMAPDSRRALLSVARAFDAADNPAFPPEPAANADLTRERYGDEEQLRAG